ncbi:MAG: hypothetical protein ABI947_15905 [Chloroflexota bacterium]
MIRITQSEGLSALVDVWNERLHCRERETVGDLIATLPARLKIETTFTYARKTRTVQAALGWLRLYLPDVPNPLWLLAIHDADIDCNIGLFTNRPIAIAAHAQAVFVTWRDRFAIEHTYRLDQEAGLDVEALHVHTIDHMRRVFLMVLTTAAFLTKLGNRKPCTGSVLWEETLVRFAT